MQLKRHSINDNQGRWKMYSPVHISTELSSLLSHDYQASSFLFYFSNIPTFKRSTSLLLFWLHPPDCVGTSDRWLVRCCVLSIIAAMVRCQITLLFFFSPATGWLVLYTHLTADMRILLAFAENVSLCAKWIAPMDRGALRTVRVMRIRKGSDESGSAL